MDVPEDEQGRWCEERQYQKYVDLVKPVCATRTLLHNQHHHKRIAEKMQLSSMQEMVQGPSCTKVWGSLSPAHVAA